MKDTRTFQQKSFQANMDTILERFDDLALYQLVNFINSKFGDTKPTELQEEFIDEFFGLEEWGEFIYGSNSLIMSNEYLRCTETMQAVREYLLFKLSHRFLDLMVDRNNIDKELTESKLEALEKEITIQETELELTKLKHSLTSAIDNSVADGIFDKVDGWCNVSDVLLNHNLINLEKD